MNNQEISKRGKYVILAPAHKLLMAKEAQQTSSKQVIANHPRLKLKRSTIEYWRRSYIKAKGNLGGREPTSFECGFVPKQGRKPLLGQWDAKVLANVKALRQGGGALNATVLAAIIQSTLEAKAPYLLSVNGGTVNPKSPTLHQSMYRRWNYVKRRATTTRKNISEADKKEKFKKFAQRVNKHIVEKNIHPSMVVNFDETSVSAVPSQSYTMEVRGTGTVRIIGKDDKRNVTALSGGALNGNKIPWQIIYGGKTKRCEVKADKFPDDWDITHTKKHWSTNPSKVQYIIKIILVYMNAMRVQHSLPPTAKGLVIFDYHTTNIHNPDFYQALYAHFIDYELIDAGMTDEEQPMDQIVNKKTKLYLRQEFDTFYLKQVMNWINAGNAIGDFKMDLRWSVIKIYNAEWLCTVYNKITAEDIRSSFRVCGITGIVIDEDENKNNN